MGYGVPPALCKAAARLEDAVKVLNIWVPRGVVILSLVSYLVLAVFSEIRRRKAHGFQRKSVWVMYQLSEWVPMYVLSNLYLETSPHDKLITAFWLPFLLQHHARPDNISAYSMEDNETWKRRMFFVPFQIIGVIYVLYRFILVNCAAGILKKASWITFFLGIFKYAESAIALRRGNLDIIWSSFKCRQLSSSFVGDYGGGKKLDDDEKALLAAQDLFDICKGAFSDYSVQYIDRDAVRSIFSDDWENMCKVVEMEISLMYDILYTKTPVVNTWVGYAIRVASPPLTAAVIVLFYLHPRGGMKTADFVITQILLWTTFLLDVRWLLRALASTWTHSFLKARPHCWFYHEFLCQGLWKKLRCFVVSLYPSKLSLWLWTCESAKEVKSYKRWARNIGQRNLLDECTTGDMYKAVGRSEIEPVYQYHSMEIEVPHYVMKLVFENICTKFFPNTSTPVDPTNVSNGEYGDGPSHNGGGRPTYVPRTSPVGSSQHPSPRRGGHSTSVGDVAPTPTSPVESTRPLDILPPYLGQRLPPCRWRPFRWPWSRTGIVPQQAANAPPGLPYNPYEQQAHRWSLGYAAYMHHESQPEPNEQHAVHGRNGHASFMYDHQSPPEAPYEQVHHHGRHSRSASLHKERDYAIKSPKSEGGGKDLPLEFQEVILIWHIATDVFLSCSPCIEGEEAKEHADAIKGMSDYMVFLVAERPSMLPGLKLRSMYETTRRALRRALQGIREKREVSKRYSSKKEHASRMLEEGKVTLTGPDTATIREGTKQARLLLSLLLPHQERLRGKHTLGPKLAHWIPDLEDPIPRTMENMLKFILDGWVRLLIYASIRCSRESHAEQLGRGGELTTLLWIISEHAGIDLVKKHSPGYFRDAPHLSS